MMSKVLNLTKAIIFLLRNYGYGPFDCPNWPIALSDPEQAKRVEGSKGQGACRFHRTSSFFGFVLLLPTLHARQLTVPFTAQRGPFNELFYELKDQNWRAFTWLQDHWRHTKHAYNNCGQTVNYAQLYFGKTHFSAQDAFANSTAQSPTNPLLATSVLGPRVKYKEAGFNIGAAFQRWHNECWRYGVRLKLPVRNVLICRLKSNGNGSSDLGGQTVADVTQERTEVINGQAIRSYAYRLDFLSRLPYACSCLGLNYNIANYRDTDFPFDLPVTLSNQDISNENGTPVSVIKTNGALPKGPLAIQQSVAQQLPILPADGSGLGQNGRARFDTSVNYLPLGSDPANQSMLFVVPSVADGNTVAPARVIQAQVDELLECIAPTAEAVFAQCGIDFSSRHIHGAGDFDTEFFLGHYLTDCLYGEAFFGITWPTGKRANNPLKVFKQPLGNNGHYAYTLGIQSLWEPCAEDPCSPSLRNWIVCKGDLSVSIVQKAAERVAAGFAGASVKNIGPTVPARIGWHYVTLHADVIITPPSRCVGISVGYELYHKSDDHLRFCRPAAIDCLGVQQQLDQAMLSRFTSVTSHKIRTEFFWDGFIFRIPTTCFIGGSKIVAGRNAPADGEFQFGFALYF